MNSAAMGSLQDPLRDYEHPISIEEVWPAAAAAAVTVCVVCLFSLDMELAQLLYRLQIV